MAVRRDWLLQTGPEAWLAVPGPGGRPDYRAPNVRLSELLVGMTFEVDATDVAPEERVAGKAVIISGAFCNNGLMRFYGDFATNVCNWLSRREVLLDIQGARYEAKSLDVKPQQIARVWWLLVIWVPGAFLALGLIVWWSRRH